ncbi:MAG: site-2 protease family protein [Hyphomicrobiaceae bacterium]
MGQIELFRIGRIPIHLDFMFILLAALWTRPFWSSGEAQLLSAAFVLAVGLFASILLHELGHAWAGRAFGIETSYIELNGIGGLCHFVRSLPASVLARTVIGLAGPVANLMLWLLFDALAVYAASTGTSLAPFVLSQLAWANKLLLIYNLLPSFPLDGGRVLEAWLAPLLGPAWSVRIVAVAGFLVAAWLVWMAFPDNYWMMLIAAILAIYNYQALQGVGGFGRI